VNNGSGDGGGCFGIEVWTDTAKLTDMVIARFGERCGHGFCWQYDERSDIRRILPTHAVWAGVAQNWATTFAQSNRLTANEPVFVG